jgi:prevent-host-death family protein
VKVASVAELKSKLADYLKASEEGPVIVTRNGKPVAVLLGVEDEDEVERLILGHSPKLRAILEESREQIRDGKGIPHDEFWAQVEAEKPARPRTRARKKTG